MGTARHIVHTYNCRFDDKDTIGIGIDQTDQTVEVEIMYGITGMSQVVWLSKEDALDLASKIEAMYLDKKDEHG